MNNPYKRKLIAAAEAVLQRLKDAEQLTTQAEDRKTFIAAGALVESYLEKKLLGV